MRKIALLAAAVAVFVLIGIDTWLCIRTFGPGTGSTFNPLINTAGAKASPISHDEDDLLLSH